MPDGDRGHGNMGAGKRGVFTEKPLEHLWLQAGIFHLVGHILCPLWSWEWTESNQGCNGKHPDPDEGTGPPERWSRYPKSTQPVPESWLQKWKDFPCLSFLTWKIVPSWGPVPWLPSSPTERPVVLAISQLLSSAPALLEMRIGHSLEIDPLFSLCGW